MGLRGQKQRILRLRILKAVLLLIVILGLLFRLTNIEQKFYWDDEVLTSLRISGYTPPEVVQEVYNGQITSVADLEQYKYPNSEQDLTDTLQALMAHPEHPPLFYLMERFWVQWFGNSVTVIRSLPILISFLTFPCLYWLCIELFESSLVGWVAMAIIAVSSLHVLYAQEAREYSLWTLTILLSNATLLRAMKLKTPLSWVGYTGTLILGLYSHLLFFLTMISQGIYVLGSEGWRLGKLGIRYGQTTLISLLVFVPWIGVIIHHRDQIQRTMSAVDRPEELSHLIDVWFRNANLAFFSADLGSFNVVPLIFAIYLLYFVDRYAPRKVRLFSLTLIGVTAAAIILPDLLLGGTRSTRLRYLTPCFLGLQITAAYFFSTQIRVIKTWKQRSWRIILILVLSTSILGCLLDAQEQITWNKGDSNAKHYLYITQLINQAPQALVISDAVPTDRDPSAIRLLKLSYELEPEVSLLLTTSSDTLKVPDQFRNLFLFYPSEALLNFFNRRTEYQPVQVIERGSFKYRFWRLLQRSG